MKNFKCFLVFFCFVSIMSFALPVIINDTGDWHGEIQADEHGFFVYNAGMWCQRGANFKDESILTFADDFSPEISSSGLNTVTCTYADIGWIWPTSGKSVSDSLQFLTANVVFSESKTVINYDYEFFNSSLTGVRSKSDYPSDGHIAINRTFPNTNTNFAAISSTLGWISTMSALASFIPGINLATSIASTVCDFLSRLYGYLAIIDEFTFNDPYDNLVPLITLENNDFWEVRGIVKAELNRIELVLFNDSDADGYVANESDKVTKYVPLCTNLRKVYEFQRINEAIR